MFYRFYYEKLVQELEKLQNEYFVKYSGGYEDCRKEMILILKELLSITEDGNLYKKYMESVEFKE